MMNRSAKDGARSSRHYGGEGILIHPSHQGVCERHGTEDLDVTLGGLVVFPGGTGITDTPCPDVLAARHRRSRRPGGTARRL